MRLVQGRTRPPARGTSHSVDREGLGHGRQRTRLAIVRTLRARLADGDCPAVAVGDAHATRAPQAPSNINLAAARPRGNHPHPR
jgi:hypothetical protein